MRDLMKSLVRVLVAIAAIGCMPALAQKITYFHNDAAGTPIVASNEQGQVVWRESYRPYGERLTKSAASASNDIFFTSRRQDSTGLTYMGARYYDPVVGRFTSMDPKGFDELNLHSHNRYAYANNNPLRYHDPDGQMAQAIVLRLTYQASYNVATYLGAGRLGSALADVLWTMNESAGADKPGGQTRPRDAGAVPEVPDKIVGDQSDARAGSNRSGTKHTSGPLAPENGGTGDFNADLDRLTGGTRPWKQGDKAPPGSLVGENGIFGRPQNSSGGKSIDIPAKGDKPHETLHYP